MNEMSVTAPDGAHALADRLTELVQELLDAHCDTVCLLEDRPPGHEWSAHAQYLKDLQRVGQRTLAELAA